MDFILEDLLNCIEIPEIDSNINFWLVRTNKGLFYEEYIKNGFVALGWNKIDKNAIKKINKAKDRDKKKKAYEKIKETYKGTKQPGRLFGKCDRFVNGIKENDIIMLPSANSLKITFALAGEYYEIDELNHRREMEVIAQIKQGWKDTLNIQCPYKKRRKIKVIKTMDGSRLNPNLYRALVSHHSISNINDYADSVLSSIFNVYYWDEKINYVFNVENERHINPIDISYFIMSFAKIVEEILQEKTDIGKINGKLNINSPGDISFALANCAKNISEFLISNKMLFLVLWISLNGGSFKIPGFEIKVESLLEKIYKFREQNNKIKNDKLERKILEEKSKNEKSNNIPIEKPIKNLQQTSSRLEINKENFNNVIDIKKYLNQDDQDI